MTNNTLLEHLTREHKIQVSDDDPCEFYGNKLLLSIKGLLLNSIVIAIVNHKLSYCSRNSDFEDFIINCSI